MNPHKLTEARRFFIGAQKQLLPAIILILLGLAIWPHRISTAGGFLLDDCFFLEETYEKQLQVFPRQYLPGVAASRPIARDAFTLLVRLFGERVTPMIWVTLFIHLTSSIIIWHALYRLTENWWASLSGAVFFVLGSAAYLPIYWPVIIADGLCTLFVACLFLFTAMIINPRGKYRPWLLLLTLPLLLAAVKTKESVIVVIVPLILMVLFRPGELALGQSTKQSRLALAIRRLRGISVWEGIWSISSVVLVGVLAVTVISPLGPGDPAHPYFPDYSPTVIGRSFLFYMGVLVFQYLDANSMSAFAGLILAVAPFLAALLLKNRLMFFGWLWFVIFMLPLATLRNHYNYTYYVYPATIGIALAVAALFVELEKRVVARAGPGLLRHALPVAFIAILFQQAYSFIRNNTLPQWLDDYHARSATMVQSLKTVLPRPAPHSEVVVIIPDTTQFLQGANYFKIIYHDPTLTGIAFMDRRAAESYLADHRREGQYVAEWTGTGFKLGQ